MFSWLTGSGKLKDEQFEEDKQKLFEFYQDAGYIDFEIRAVKFEYPEPNRLVIRFTIYEGKQYRVGSVTFKGNEKFSQDAIQRGVVVLGAWVRPPMLAGSVFTPKGLEKDIEAIQDFYGAFGYIGRGSADRIPVAPLKVPNIDLGTMDLVFQVDEGEKSRIERIDIAGNTRTKDRVIRRELAVVPGEDFNMVKVKMSTERLKGMGFIAGAQSEVEPTDLRDRKNLVVTVEEGQSGQFFLGAGFSTVEKLFGYVGITQGNFDLFNPPSFVGGGQKLRVQATVGTELSNYELKFVEPWFLGRKLALEVNLFYQDIGYYSTVYDQSQKGAKIGLYRPLFIEALRAGVSYTIEDIDISFKDGTTMTNVVVSEGPGRGRNNTIIPPTISPQMAKEAGNYLVSMPAFTLAYDTRGGGFLPNRGQRTEVTVSLAGGPFGGNTDFWMVELESAWYFEGLAPGHVLELVGKIGVEEGFGDTEQVPIFNRFFLGGAYSLRGYAYRMVGPVDIYDQPLGGQSYWFGSAEYSIPIMERLRVAAFYDVGMVYAEPWGFNSNLWCDNVGGGLRINIPSMGPLRLDYAWPIHHVPWVSGKPHFQFSVGYTRGY
jgi:outer membrane protein insertion porin family